MSGDRSACGALLGLSTCPDHHEPPRLGFLSLHPRRRRPSTEQVPAPPGGGLSGLSEGFGGRRDAGGATGAAFLTDRTGEESPQDRERRVGSFLDDLMAARLEDFEAALR